MAVLPPPAFATTTTGMLRSPAGARFRLTQWQVMLGIMVCYLFFYTGRQNLGFAVSGMRAELGYSATAVAALNAAMLIGYGAGQILNGNFSDMLSLRRMITIGALLSVGCNWAFSFATAPWIAVLLWFANGMAQSTGSPALRRLIVNWFAAHQRGTAIGLHLLSAGFSSAITFSICIWVVSSYDWRWVFRIPPTTILISLALFLLLVRNRPEDAGFPPLPPEDSEMPAPHAAESSLTRYLQVLGNRHFLLACLSIGFESLARYGLLSWVPVHFGAGGNLWVTVGLPIGMAIGALSAGIIADRWLPTGRARLAAIALGAGAVIALLLTLLPKGSPFAFVLLAAAGFLVYAPQSSYWTLGPLLVSRERSGTATGLMDATAYGFAAAGQLLIGATIDATGSTLSLFFVIAAACLCGALVILPVRK